MRRGLLTLGGWALAGAAILALIAGMDIPGAFHAAWFWWLKAAALPLGALAVLALTRATRTED